jgi:chromosome segregation ATPase
MIATRKPQTLAEALGAPTQVVNFKERFGDNPIRDGHSAAKYLKKPQTLAEALGAKTEVVDFKETFGDNPIRQGHSAAKYLETAVTTAPVTKQKDKKMKKMKGQPISAMERMGALGLNLDKPPVSASQEITTIKPQTKKPPTTLAEALGVSTKVVNFSEEFGNNPIREGHSAAKYLKKPQTLAEALGVKTEVVNFQKSFGSNPVRKGHSAAKYLAAAKIQEMQQYLVDMKNRTGDNPNKSKAVGDLTPGMNTPSKRLSSDPLGADKEAEITEAHEKFGELKGEVYDLFNYVQRSVEGGRKQIAQEAAAIERQDRNHWDAMSNLMDQFQASTARETVLNKDLTESMSALTVEQERVKETELKFSEAQGLLELKQDQLFTAMGRLSNLEAERFKLQRGTKNLDAATQKLYDAQALIQRDSMSLQNAKVTHSKNLKELSKRERELQEKATTTQQERDEALKRLKGFETSLATSRAAFKQARELVSELQVTNKELEQQTEIAEAENEKVSLQISKLSAQGQQHSTESINLAGKVSSLEIRASDSRKELDKAKTALELAKRQREENDSTVAHNQVLLASHEELIQTIGEKVQFIGSEVKKLRTENNALAKQSEVLVQDKHALESQAVELRDSMAGHVSKLEAAAAFEVKLEQQVTWAQGQLANVQRQVKDVELALPVCESALTTARERIQELQTKLQNMEGRMKILQGEKAEMVRERSMHRNKNGEEQEQLVTLSHNVEASELNVAALQKELDESMVVLESAKSLQMEAETRAKESDSLLSTHRQDLETAHGRIAAFKEEKGALTISGQVATLDTVTAELSEARESLENQSKLLQETEASTAEELAEAAARETSLREAADMVRGKREMAEAQGEELEETLCAQMKDMEAASEQIEALKTQVDGITEGRTRDIEFHFEETKSTKKWAALSCFGIAALVAVAVSAVQIPAHTTATGDTE